jgi:hypothetical protein
MAIPPSFVFFCLGMKRQRFLSLVWSMRMPVTEEAIHPR